MSTTRQPANDAEPILDPEIEALLDFEPVPRKTAPPGAWTPEAQRAFIAKLAMTGSQGKACGEVGKDRGGATKLYRSPEAGSFRAAWHAAIELYKRRQAEKLSAGPPPALQPPTVDGRRKFTPPPGSSHQGEGLPGQVMNEHGEWEDEESYARRGEEAKDSIGAKLLRCRRLFLVSVAECPGKRAAFEMLTELPIDWEKAARMEPQDDEPWRKPNMREPDMVMTAESGWLMGEIGYGPDKKAELRRELDAFRAEHGMPAIEWDESAESSEQA